MAKAIFRVEYQERWTKSGAWESNRRNVLAPDAETAISRVKAWAMKQTAQMDDGTTLRVTAFRLTGVDQIAEAEL